MDHSLIALLGPFPLTHPALATVGRRDTGRDGPLLWPILREAGPFPQALLGVQSAPEPCRSSCHRGTLFSAASPPERCQANLRLPCAPRRWVPRCGTGSCGSEEGDGTQIWGMEPLAQGCLTGGSLPVRPSLTCHLSPLQLYELDEDPKRKEFLDDLFGFMQKRGTPVNRIPIMAKQVLDLYTLYRLVTEKGGLVEVINKKIWREITKGLNLPTSITSAAFTLRTQYMKYLYPYECEKRALSSPGELQAAIDSNRREGRRQSFGTALFSYSPIGTPTMLSSPKIPVPALAIATHSCSQISQVHAIKKGGLGGDGKRSAGAAALEQLREKLETGEPPQKKACLVSVSLNADIGVSSPPDDRQETALNLSSNGISSLNMSIEINGVVYTEQNPGSMNPTVPLLPTGKVCLSWQGLAYSLGTPGAPAPCTGRISLSHALAFISAPAVHSGCHTVPGPLKVPVEMLC
uniref:AT-rich interactive domain-containing protein 3 n=1 Tax=Pelusios castaneus TaxID=367368 RepID=A0A8C8VFW7_9SAUR